MNDVIIVGGGIGGLTLALALDRAGIASTIYESTSVIQQAGVGINILPYAMRVLADLGLEEDLVRRAIATRSSTYYDRCGTLIHQTPLGRLAGDAYPQLSIHRAELQGVLLEAVHRRLGPDRVKTGWHCEGVVTNHDAVTLEFRGRAAGEYNELRSGSLVIACDGIHSKVRRQFYPCEGAPRYSGVFMWRGITRAPRFLDGVTMARIGLPSVGKMVVYPIRTYDDGTQLINWVAEVEVPDSEEGFCKKRDWNCPGDAADFIGVFRDWRFDWLDVPELIRNAQMILQFPMMDRDPLPRWSFGRVSLLGDAAHPLVPLGSNGAGQAILDAEALAGCLASYRDPVEALARYESLRLPATAETVMSDRAGIPDTILKVAEERIRSRAPAPNLSSAAPRTVLAA